MAFLSAAPAVAEWLCLLFEQVGGSPLSAGCPALPSVLMLEGEGTVPPGTGGG